MRVLMRAGTILMLLAVGVGTASIARAAAPVDEGLRHRVERRFEVLPVRGGVVLTPKHHDDVKSIEIRDGVIALNGDPATGSELREKLGDDAELVLQVSYLSPETLAHWGQEAAAPPATSQQPAPTPADAAPVPAPPTPPATSDDSNEERRSHRRRSASRVHVGGGITVNEDEEVGDAVVAIGGSVTVLGHVDDDVVAIGGGVHLGPKAVVRGGITSIGGHIEREPGSVVDGEINEVRIGPPSFKLHAPQFMGFAPAWDAMHGWLRLVGTVIRLGIDLLLTILVALLAARPVERIGDRAAREPWMSGFAGLLAQLLFIPVLVLTVVVLAVSIIGIPLLVLVPFAVVAFLLAMLVGFAGVSLRVGQWAVGPHRAVPLALAVGVILIAAVALVSRGVGLLPIPTWFLTWPLGIAGFFVEYVAWTVGLGAALLTRFGSRRGPYEGIDVVPPPIPSFDGPSAV
jgi:hypothetical protein